MKSNRILCLALAMTLIFAALGYALLGELLHHDCQGADCEICMIISIWGVFARGLLLLLASAALLFAFAASRARVVPFSLHLTPTTPLLLRVMLLN